METKAHTVSLKRAGILAVCLWLSAFGAWAQSRTIVTGNPSNDKLLGMPEYGQAAMLSKATGYSCVGKDPFYMGVEKRHPNKGVAFWSITCSNGGQKFLIAIAPDTYGSTMYFSCDTYKGRPWKCYKKIKD